MDWENIRNKNLALGFIKEYEQRVSVAYAEPTPTSKMELFVKIKFRRSLSKKEFFYFL